MYMFMYDLDYTSQFEHETESSFVLLSHFRTNIGTFIRSFVSPQELMTYAFSVLS